MTRKHASLALAEYYKYYNLQYLSKWTNGAQEVGGDSTRKGGACWEDGHAQSVPPGPERVVLALGLAILLLIATNY